MLIESNIALRQKLQAERTEKREAVQEAVTTASLLAQSSAALLGAAISNAAVSTVALPGVALTGAAILNGAKMAAPSFAEKVKVQGCFE